MNPRDTNAKLTNMNVTVEVKESFSLWWITWRHGWVTVFIG